MKVKKCCDKMYPTLEFYPDDGTVSFDDGCCNLFQDWKFCNFCGTRFELEPEK